MDELVSRLRAWASDLTREAACGGVWQESIDANHARSETLHAGRGRPHHAHGGAGGAGDDDRCACAHVRRGR